MNPELTRWFRAAPGSLSIQQSKVDAENGILYDVVMVEEGDAKGHGVKLDASFIDAITAFDQKHFTKNGLKARFGHPSASSETMGTQMGVFKDFRSRKNEETGKMQEIANLHLLDAADQSPTHPGMRQWVLSMAQQNPEFIMSSIVFRASGYYKVMDGSKVMVEYDYEHNSFSGDPELPVFVEFDETKGASHHYTDLVEAGAATESLFSNQVNTHLYVAQVDNFLQENQHLADFLRDNPAAVQRWLKRAGYSITHSQTQKMSKFSFSKWLFGEEQEQPIPTPTDLEEMRTALSDARTEIATLKQERDEFKAKYEAAFSQANELAAQVKQLTTDAEELRNQLTSLNERLSNVEKDPAAKPTGGDTPPAEKAWANSAANQATSKFATRKRIPSPTV